MVITYNGENYFKLQSGSAVVLVDPTDQRSLRGANLVLSTVNPPKINPEKSDNAFFIVHQGEYEIEGIRVWGYTAYWSDGKGNNRQEHTIYHLTFDGLRIAVFGYLAKMPAPEIVDKLGDVDIMIAPGGGEPYLSVENTAKLIRQIEPVLFIPALTAKPDKLLSEFDLKCQPEEKIVIKKKDLSPGTFSIKCLKPKP